MLRMRMRARCAERFDDQEATALLKEHLLLQIHYVNLKDDP